MSFFLPFGRFSQAKSPLISSASDWKTKRTVGMSASFSFKRVPQKIRCLKRERRRRYKEKERRKEGKKERRKEGKSSTSDPRLTNSGKSSPHCWGQSLLAISTITFANLLRINDSGLVYWFDDGFSVCRHQPAFYRITRFRLKDTHIYTGLTFLMYIKDLTLISFFWSVE